MSQNDVIEFLSKNPRKWFWYKPISEALEVGQQSIIINLRKLRKHKLVQSKLVKQPKRISIIMYKHKKQNE